jgi:hypothetical protein
MGMRMQTAEVGSYELTVYKNNEGVWEFWVRQKGQLLVKSIGTKDCKETKRALQRHLHDVVMTREEQKHFGPTKAIEWRNYLHSVGFGPEKAG